MSKSTPVPTPIVIDAKEGEIVCYDNFYSLHKEISKKMYVFRRSFINVWQGEEVIDKKKLKTIDKTSWTIYGREMPPFTQPQLDEFRKFKEEELLNIVKNG